MPTDKQADIFAAARDGKLSRLRLLLGKTEKGEVFKLIQSTTNGATPLVIACRNGHLAVVEYLLVDCKCDVEQVGSVSFDGESIEGAPPLWCAAAAGHENIVKILIQQNACVNSTTYTNSTPLRAACFDGHHNIVKLLVDNSADIEIANRHGHTCLMIACYKGHLKIAKFLIDQGANVNRSSLKGNTAMHDCAESGSLEIMQLLLESGAKFAKDSYGVAPLLAAAVTGHSKIVNYLISRQDCQNVEKINALKLLGATFVDKNRDMMGAIQLWKKAALEKGSSCTDNDAKHSQYRCETLAAYDNAVEAHTIEELNNLISDPDGMRMQALLLREKILGPSHPDTSYYIRYRGAVYADLGNFDRCIVLWNYALDMQQKNLGPLNLMTQSSFLSFAELFYFMGIDGRTRSAQCVSFKDMFTVLSKAVEELRSGILYLQSETISDKEKKNFNRLLVIVMHLLSLISTKMTFCTEGEQYLLKKKVYELVKLDARGNKQTTPLHMACSEETSTVGRYPVCTFPSLDVVKLLLESGASSNSRDTNGDSPLHVVMRNKLCKTEIVHLLLMHDAHLDATNNDNKSAFDVFKSASLGDICPLKYINLQCLSAKVVKQCNINYKGMVSKKLETFISQH